MTLIHPRHALCCSLQLFLILMVCVQAHGQPPVGDWDFVLSGRQRGVAHITVSPDGTLAGRAVHTAARNLPGPERSAALLTNRFGAARLEGGWSFQRGSDVRIIGYINFFAEPGESPAPNMSGISFRGVVSGSRLILRTRGFGGQVRFRGMPLLPAADLSGTFYVQGRTIGRRNAFVEIFTLSPMTSEEDGSLLPNSYFVTGGGPGYDYEGWLLVSGFEYAALSQNRADDGESVAAYAGRFRTETGRGTLKGMSGANRNVRLLILRGL